MFERFTDRARRIVALANQKAMAGDRMHIEPLHLVLSLGGFGEAAAVVLLNRLGVGWSVLETRAAELAPPRESGFAMGKLPMTTETKRIIEHAVEESRVLDDRHVGSEHVLLGLLRTDDATVRGLWRELTLDADRARQELQRMRTESPGLILDDVQRAMTRAPEPVGAYPSCRQVGNLLFLSGQGPRQRGSKDIPGVRLDAAGKMLDYDMEAQVRAVMQNVRYILEENGSSWDRIVDMTCFLTNMERDFAVYNRVYAEYFPPGPSQPCRTTLGIASLPQAGSAPIAFEVKVIAEVNQRCGNG